MKSSMFKLTKLIKQHYLYGALENKNFPSSIWSNWIRWVHGESSSIDLIKFLSLSFAFIQCVKPNGYRSNTSDFFYEQTKTLQIIFLRCNTLTHYLPHRWRKLRLNVRKKVSLILFLSFAFIQLTLEISVNEFRFLLNLQQRSENGFRKREAIKRALSCVIWYS